MASVGQQALSLNPVMTELPPQAPPESPAPNMAAAQAELYQPQGKATRLTMLIVWMLSLKNQRMRSRVGQSYARQKRPKPQQGV